MNGINGSHSVGVLADKAKFTVSVRGHQWSSARHVHETLQEFAKVIEKNARRLGFISQDDKVERLQLARSADGTDPEELDVDATLEDVLICMGRKQLIALITPTSHAELSAVCPRVPADMPGANHPLAGMQTNWEPLAGLNTENAMSVDNMLHTARNYSLATPTSAPSCREDLNHTVKCTRVSVPESLNTGMLSIKSEALTGPQFIVGGGRVTSNQPRSLELPHESAFKRTMYRKGLQISIPDTDLDQIGSPTQVANSTSQAPPPASNSYAKNLLLPTITYPPSLTAPCPAELAQLLVETSSIQYPSLMAGSAGMGNNPFLTNPSWLFNEVLELPHPQCLAPPQSFQPFDSLAPMTWLNSSAKPIDPANPMITTANSLKFPTPNIKMLAQFLASQLRAFVPTEINQSTSFPPPMNDEQLHPSTNQSALQDNVVETLTHCQETACLADNASLTNSTQINNRSPCSGLDPRHSVIESGPDKDQSSSSVIDAHQNAQSQPEMIFLVNRRSKTGTGTHRLKMSELSMYFHLSVVDAAKKLGVSQTTLKKACRKFGLKRWPGRKVRSLESTIHGLEHTIAVGQGTGMEELTEAQIRSEVLKLQQEMDHLVQGLSSMQHPTALRTADLYKRLYSRGWRSKHHSSEGSNGLQIDGDAKAVATNNHSTSTLTSCNLESSDVHTQTAEALSNTQTITAYSEPVESDHKIEVPKPENDGQNSCAIDEARDCTHDRSNQWVTNMVKSARSKRKRRFWNREDNRNTRFDMNKQAWRDDFDNTADSPAGENPNHVLCGPANTGNETIHPIDCDRNPCLCMCRLGSSLDNDLRTPAN